MAFPEIQAIREVKEATINQALQENFGVTVDEIAPVVVLMTGRGDGKTRIYLTEFKEKDELDGWSEKVLVRGDKEGMIYYDWNQDNKKFKGIIMKIKSGGRLKFSAGDLELKGETTLLAQRNITGSFDFGKKGIYTTLDFGAMTDLFSDKIFDIKVLDFTKGDASRAREKLFSFQAAEWAINRLYDKQEEYKAFKPGEVIKNQEQGIVQLVYEVNCRFRQSW